MVDTVPYEADSEEEEAEAGGVAIGPRPPTARSMANRPSTQKSFEVGLLVSAHISYHSAFDLECSGPASCRKISVDWISSE